MAITNWNREDHDLVEWGKTREKMRKWGNIAEGVVFHDELAGSSGASFLLLPEAHHTDEDIKKAANRLYRDRDVVRMSVLRIEPPAPVAKEAAPEWAPVYSPWRHGGWYVSNVRYPSGATGCVSNNYPDKKWRIVCDDRRSELGEPGDVTFATRDEAARAEYDLARAMQDQEDAQDTDGESDLPTP